MQTQKLILSLSLCDLFFADEFGGGLGDGTGSGGSSGGGAGSSGIPPAHSPLSVSAGGVVGAGADYTHVPRYQHEQIIESKKLAWESQVCVLHCCCVVGCGWLWLVVVGIVCSCFCSNVWFGFDCVL
jgi:hypothetical protein